ncbi:MAG TPA: hypothetical protein PKL26_05010, partial [Methanolinea sp.]|nr:hypothetical protein [Methanolinea sp.]
MGVRLGVLALQGDVSEHIRGFRAALAEIGEEEGLVIPVRRPADLDGLSDFDEIARAGEHAPHLRVS